MKNVLGKSKIELACAACTFAFAFSSAFSFSGAASAQVITPPKTTVSTPTLKMAGTITGMTAPTGPSAVLTIHGTNGDEPCRFVVKATPSGSRGPMAIEVGLRVKFPVTVTWGPIAGTTSNFQATGEASGSVKACQGSASATFYAAIPPPPEVNP